MHVSQGKVHLYFSINRKAKGFFVNIAYGDFIDLTSVKLDIQYIHANTRVNSIVLL